MRNTPRYNKNTQHYNENTTLIRKYTALQLKTKKDMLLWLRGRAPPW